MESQPQNPEFGDNSETFTHVNYMQIFIFLSLVLQRAGVCC